MATVVTQFPTFAQRAHGARAAADQPRTTWRHEAGFLRLFPARRTRLDASDQHSASIDPDPTTPDAA
jgi:hypothetical protein